MDRPPFRFAVQATNAAGRPRVARYRPQSRRPRVLNAFPCGSLSGPGPRAAGRAHPSPRPGPDRGDGCRGRRQRDAAHRVPGVLHRLSRAGGIGQGSGDTRSAVRRPAGIGHRRRLERSRVHRDGPRVRPSGPTNRQAGRGRCLYQGPLAGRRTGLLGRFRSGARIRGTAAAGATATSADHDRRGRTARPVVGRPGSRHRQHLQRAVRGARRRRP